MGEQGPVIKVHSGSSLIFSCSKSSIDSNDGTKSIHLVSSLKEIQSQVNQFLTELVEKNASQQKEEGQGEGSSDTNGKSKSSKSVKCSKQNIDSNDEDEDSSSSSSEGSPKKKW